VWFWRLRLSSAVYKVLAVGGTSMSAVLLYCEVMTPLNASKHVNKNLSVLGLMIESLDSFASRQVCAGSDVL
jgi:hypothetical protein